MANFEIGTEFQNRRNREKALELLAILQEKEKHLFQDSTIDHANKEAVRTVFSVKKITHVEVHPMTLIKDEIEYKLVEVTEGELTKNRLEVDLPLLIEQVNIPFMYYCEDLRTNRYTHEGYWFVSQSDKTPANFKLEVKEFKPCHLAILHAVRSYRKYLRSELNRIKDY